MTIDAALLRLNRLADTRHFDLGLAALIAVGSVVGLAAGGVELRPAAIVVLVALSLAALVRRQHAVAAALVIAPLILVFGLTDDFARENGVLFLGTAVLCYSLGTREDRDLALAATAALFACCQLLKVLGHDGMSPPFLFVTFGPWILGRIVQSRRRLVEELEVRANELDAELDTYTDLVVRRERARVARELHDIVAHCVAVMVIQAGAGRLTTSGSRQEAARSFTRIREAGSEALGELERLVSVLMQDADGAHRPGRLDALVHQTQAAGLNVQVVASPDAEPDETAFRIVQEGLTNALKYAPGAAVTVTLTERGGGLDIDITNAPGRTHPALGFETSRRGLVGIRERVKAVGGRMEAGGLPGGGWRLSAYLPRSPARHPEAR